MMRNLVLKRFLHSSTSLARSSSSSTSNPFLPSSRCVSPSFSLSLSLLVFYLFIYIYIYTCVCVCVYTCVLYKCWFFVSILVQDFMLEAEIVHVRWFFYWFCWFFFFFLVFGIWVCWTELYKYVFVWLDWCEWVRFWKCKFRVLCCLVRLMWMGLQLSEIKMVSLWKY